MEPGDHQRAEHTADAGDRQDPSEQRVGGVELVADEERDRHRVVERERAHDRVHAHGEAQHGIGPHRPQPVADRGGARRRRCVAVQAVGVDRHQRPQQGEERHPVEHEAPAGAEHVGEQGGERRAEDPRPGHDRRVQRHHVRQVLTFDELGGEPPARRVVDRTDDAERQRHHVDDRDRHDVGEVEHAEDDRLDAHRGLGDDRQPPPVEAVGQGAGPEPDQQHREELAGGDDAERHARCRRGSGRAAPGPSPAATSRCWRPPGRRRTAWRCARATTGTSANPCASEPPISSMATRGTGSTSAC